MSGLGPFPEVAQLQHRVRLVLATRHRRTLFAAGGFQTDGVPLPLFVREGAQAVSIGLGKVRKKEQKNQQRTRALLIPLVQYRVFGAP